MGKNDKRKRDASMFLPSIGSNGKVTIYELVPLEGSRGQFREWYDSLPHRARLEVAKRVFDAGRANYGKVNQYAADPPKIYALRIQNPTKLRVYFAVYKGQAVVLLDGGGEDGQSEDITRAKKAFVGFEAYAMLCQEYEADIAKKGGIHSEKDKKYWRSRFERAQGIYPSRLISHTLTHSF